MKQVDKNVYTKSRLIKELAFRSGIKQTASKQLLEVLAEIAYRETRMGPFVIPGICKLELCDRKARKMRNPRTGAQLIMPPHKALRITASRLCKNAVAPRVSAVPAESYVPPTEPVVAPAPAPVAPAPVTAEVAPTPVEAAPEAAPEVTPEVAPEVAVEAAPEVAAEAVAEVAAEETPEMGAEESAEAAVAPESEMGEVIDPEPQAEEGAPEEAVEEGDAVSFRCPGCQQEIEAPRECVGQEAECPMCGRIVIIPPKSEPGTMYGEVLEGEDVRVTAEVVSAKAAEDMDPSRLKNCTIRIDASVLSGLGEEPKEEQPSDENMISFFCKKCHQEIEASIDMVGSMAECPNCGEQIEIPMASDTGSLYDALKEQSESDKKNNETQKRRTMRIDLGDDF